MKCLIGLISFISFLPVTANAFWVSEHRQITDTAIQKLQSCDLLPKSWSTKNQTEFLRADLNEDLNLARKWTLDSHYYNPTKDLHTRRRTSDQVIANILAELTRGSDSSAKVYEQFGRIAHYLQDAAVPAHVVPVVHFLHDGFEAFSAQSSAEISCADLKALPLETPMEILKETALSTLNQMTKPFTYTENALLKYSSWQNSFWIDAQGPVFGGYSDWGNVFGQTKFTTKQKDEISVDLKTYSDFKQTQLALAVLATEKLLLQMSADQ